MMDDIKKIGIWWLKEEISENGESKSYCWWGICKKTRKVAFMRCITNSFYQMLPVMMNDIYLSESKGCDDGKFCLNLECPYALNNELITSILKQESIFEELEPNNVVDYFERSIKFITEEFIEGLSEEDLNKIFVDDLEHCTVNENAFETKLPE